MLCKPPTTVLAPKNPNIMPRKSGLFVGSSKRSKGHHVPSPLNPDSHGAVVISNKSTPISTAHGPVQQSGLTAANDSNLTRNESRVQLDIGDVASSMVE
ncbi:hypothetical protein V6N13_059233 [Hibiscus sabdariffa]|uniref:Uncharacterized protein n=1 Tax=Hibiscus sabdariffa TaxID=183260 RepID=A0ABR2GE28_9ROSI